MTEHLYETNTLIIIISTIISAIVSLPVITLLYFQVRNAQKQTKNLDDEIRHRVRPWIRIDPMLITYGITKDHTKAWKDRKSTDDDIITVRFPGSLKNIGSTPSKEILIKTISSSSPMNKNNFHEFIQDDDKTTLLPGEDYPLNVSIRGEDFNKLNKTPLYYGVHIKYSYDNKKYASIGKIFKINRDGTTISEYWHDEPPNIKYD